MQLIIRVQSAVESIFRLRCGQQRTKLADELVMDRYGDGDEDDYDDGALPCDLGRGPGRGSYFQFCICSCPSRFLCDLIEVKRDFIRFIVLFSPSRSKRR